LSSVSLTHALLLPPTTAIRGLFAEEGPTANSLHALRSSLEKRLQALEREAELIRKALQALRRPARRSEKATEEPPVEPLQRMPNVRASVLAMAGGASLESVRDELRFLEEQGTAVTRNEKWNLTRTDPGPGLSVSAFVTAQCQRGPRQWCIVVHTAHSKFTLSVSTSRTRVGITSDQPLE
jgi:hypothetical protein